MTEKNNPHARRVTVSRVGEHRSDPTGGAASGRKVVAVRLRNDHEQPRPTDVLSEPAQTIPAEEIAPSDVSSAIEPAAKSEACEETACASETPQQPETGEPAEAESTDEAETTDRTDTPEQQSDCTSEAEITDESAKVPADTSGCTEEPSSQEDEPTDDADGEEASDTDTPDADSAEEAEEATVCEVTANADEVPVEQTEADVPHDEPAQTESAGEPHSEEAADADIICESPEPTGIAETYSEAEIEESPAAPAKWYIPQQWRDINIPRRIIMILSAALFLFSCLPLFVGVISPGILPPAMIAAFFFLCALYWPLIDGCESTWGNVLIAVVAVCVLAGVTYLSFVSGKMISASANTLPENRSDVTVVVLGCRIHGDRPSRMLHARLETAAEFLLEHPQAHCIVTGGQGEDEDYPEAFVMKNYLVDKGVSPMRIVMEPDSTSTLENITFSAEMAEKYNCHERFLIVTDRFHQYRAMRTANDLGIVSYALNVETAWYLAMPYWFREMAAITRDWIAA